MKKSFLKFFLIITGILLLIVSLAILLKVKFSMVDKIVYLTAQPDINVQFPIEILIWTAVVLLIIVFAPLLINVKVKIVDNVVFVKAFTVKFEIPIAEISIVELIERKPKSGNAFGIYLPGLKLGKFSNKEWRIHTCATHKQLPYIHVSANCENYVFSVRKSEDTINIYNEIIKLIDKNSISSK